MTSFATPRGSALGPAILSIVLGTLTLMGHGCAAPSGERFATPEQAGAALAVALSPFDQEKLREVLGPGSEEVISSGDPVADRQIGERFARAFGDHHEASTNEDGSVTLVVGNDRWPLPIPLVADGNGWVFDTEEGKQEIIDRRIGRNELSAIEVCLAIVDAQHEYFSLDPDGDGVNAYADRFRSDVGSHNGLYWAAAAGEPISPLGSLASAAAAEGYKVNNAQVRTPYHGYFYKILTSQGENAPEGAKDYKASGRMADGFAIVAWPADYENSGVMSFIVARDGVVFQRDLGPDTARLAEGMESFDPGPEWELAQ